MGRIIKPGEDDNRREVSLGKGPGAKPQMTAKMVSKVMDVVNSHLDTKFNPDGFIDELRAEYDHRVKTAQPLCDSGIREKCNRMEKGTLFCSWSDYLNCSLKTLEWRKKDIVENAETIGGQASPIEIQAMHHILDLSIEAIRKYVGRGSSSLQKGPER